MSIQNSSLTSRLNFQKGFLLHYYEYVKGIFIWFLTYFVGWGGDRTSRLRHFFGLFVLIFIPRKKRHFVKILFIHKLHIHCTESPEMKENKWMLNKSWDKQLKNLLWRDPFFCLEKTGYQCKNWSGKTFSRNDESNSFDSKWRLSISHVVLELNLRSCRKLVLQLFRITFLTISLSCGSFRDYLF